MSEEEFYNPRSKKDGESEPHPDFRQNLDYWDKMRNKCIFSEEMVVGMQEMRHAGWVQGLQFAHGPIGNRTGVCVLSFHQPQRDFRRESCNILNFFGGKGLLTRKEEPRQTSPPISWSW